MPISYIKQALALVRAQKGESRPVDHEEAPELLDYMRSKAPIDGTDYKSAHCVMVKTSAQIPSHTHAEWIVLFYAEPAGTPVEIEGEEYLPKAGEILVLPPMVEHAVPFNQSDTLRVSIAMKVVDDGRDRE